MQLILHFDNTVLHVDREAAILRLKVSTVCVLIYVSTLKRT